MAKDVPNKLRRSFNLLKPYVPPLTGWDKLYDWIVNRARVILIVVELVVFIAFFSKVAIDVTAKNLNESVAREQQILSQFSATSLPNIRDLQVRESTYTTLWNNSSAYFDVVQEVYSYISNPGNDIRVSVSSGTVQVSGSADLDELVLLEQKFKDSETFITAYIDQLVTDADSDNEGQYILVGIISEENVREQL